MSHRIHTHHIGVLPLLFSLCLLWLCPWAMANPPPPWRIAYIESGPHVDFTKTLAALVKAMEHQGLIPRGSAPPPDQRHDGKAMWQWLNQHAKGGAVEFLPGGYYTAAWHSGQRAENKEALLRRIRQNADVDLILAMGTRAGLDMATDEHTVPTFVLGTTDPVQAGISRTSTDSGRDHVFVQVLPYRQERQLALFHKILHFTRLGVIYEDTPEGHAVTGMRNIEEAALQNGFDLVRCTLAPTEDVEQRTAHLRQCLEQVASSSDAVYLTFAVATQGLPMGDVLEPLIRAEIPSFSQKGVEDTRQGVLMSLSEWNYDERGEALTHALQLVMRGTMPRSLHQELHPRLGLAINLRMAALIDWNLPPEALVAVDELCDEVIMPHRPPVNTR